MEEQISIGSKVYVRNSGHKLNSSSRLPTEGHKDRALVPEVQSRSVIELRSLGKINILFRRREKAKQSMLNLQHVPVIFLIYQTQTTLSQFPQTYVRHKSTFFSHQTPLKRGSKITGTS